MTFGFAYLAYGMLSFFSSSFPLGIDVLFVFCFCAGFLYSEPMEVVIVGRIAKQELAYTVLHSLIDD